MPWEVSQGENQLTIINKLFHQKKGYKERIINEPEQHTVVDDTHEPLISDEVFMEAQKKWKVKSELVFRGRGKKSLFGDITINYNFKNPLTGKGA